MPRAVDLQQAKDNVRDSSVAVADQRQLLADLPRRSVRTHEARETLRILAESAEEHARVLKALLTS